jgi:hypothetical protein
MDDVLISDGSTDDDDVFCPEPVRAGAGPEFLIA